MASNDVPEYLNELIPYRCPKCGHLRRFATLRELRQHLQLEHSFQMGFIKPHTRPQVFKGSRDGINASSVSRSLSSEEKLSGTSSKYGRDTVNEIRRNDNEYYGNKKFRETSPLLKSFKEETEVLEKELHQARQNEMKHKALSMHSLADSSINMDFRTSLEAINRPTESKFNPGFNTVTDFTNPSASHNPPNLHRNFVEKTKTSPRRQFGSSYDFKSTLDSLNSEVMKSRMNQWVTTDALYKSQDLLREMESTAEMKCEEQRGIIEQLVQEMKTKDTMLESRTQQHAELSTERQRLLDETESLVKQTDDYNTRLRHELDGRGKILEGMNKELGKLKTQSERQIKSKEYDLQNATQKINKLEWERDRLIQETDDILKRADQDTGKLRQTLQSKEEELQNVNETLNQLRQQQQSMLERTMTVYRSSEESREIMKTAIQTKDGQLQHAMKQIEDMTSLHKRLLEQSQLLTYQADDNTSSMKRLLRAKGEQIHDLVQQLDTLKKEKRYLENSTTSLAEQAETSLSVVENLRDMVQQKESDLKTTQSELQNLKSFLKATADKERGARKKLEVFIEDLIKRAEVAESELHVLKSQSTHSSSTLRDVKTESASDIHQSESTERKSLPVKLEHYRHSASLDQEPAFASQRQNLQLKPDNVDPVPKDEMPLQNIFITMADVHEAEQLESVARNEDQMAVNDITKTANNMRNMLNIKGQRLEESGGFVVQGENNFSEESGYLQTPEYLTVSKKKPASQRDQDKAQRRKKSKDRRSRHDHSYASTSDEAVDIDDGFSKRKRSRKHRDTLKATVSPRNERRARQGFEEEGGETESNTNYSETQGRSDTEYYSVEGSGRIRRDKKDRKVSRGLQVGAFLSTQDMDYDVEDDSEDSGTASDEGSYADIEYENVQNKSVNEVTTSEKHSKRTDKRPITMGKSHQKESVASVARQNNRKSNKQPKRSLNRNFDTKFPNSHTSMVNITSDRMDLSEGEILLRNADRHRRSRSLSPRTLDARASYLNGEVIEYSSDTSLYEDVTNDEDDVDMQDKDVAEKTDGVFKYIMDDNGILWDDDMATLPDVSDSEFDRVSPSGSEAIATKNTCNTTTTAFSALQGSAKTSNTKDKTAITSNTDVAPDDTDEISISKVAHLLNSRPKHDDSIVRSTHQRITASHASETTYKDSYPKKVSSVDQVNKKNTEYTSEDLNSTKVHFRPIKSPLYSKSSTSEKDLSSGGKEVKNIMKTSPRIDILGTSASGTRSRGSSASDSRIDSRSSRIIVKTDAPKRYKTTENSATKDPEREISTCSQPSRFSIKKLDSKYTRNTKERKNNNESVTSSGVRSRSRKDTKDNDIGRNTQNPRQHIESVEDKIERISSKYSPKHVNKPIKAEEKSPLNIDERIKSINNKYKRRREDILQGKGIGQRDTYLSDESVDSSRTISHIADSSSLEKRSPHVQNIKPVSMATDSVLLDGETAVKHSAPRLASSPHGTFAKDQHVANSIYPNHGYPPWPRIEGQDSGQGFMGYPYMQYPMLMPYPPNGNKYPYFPIHPEHQTNLPQQQSQEQQNQQQKHATEHQNQQQLHFDEHQNQHSDTTISTEHSRNKHIGVVPGTEYTSDLKPKETTKKTEDEIKEIERGHNTNVLKSVSQPDIYLDQQKPHTLVLESDIKPEQMHANEMKQTKAYDIKSHDVARNESSENKPMHKSSKHIETKLNKMPIGEIKSDICKSPTPAELLQKRAEELATLSKTESVKLDDEKETWNETDDKISYIEENHKRLVNTHDQTPNEKDVNKSDMVSTEENLPSEMLNPHSVVNTGLSAFDDTDNAGSSLSEFNKSSIFAEEIDEVSSAGYDSNTRSYLDLPGTATDTDMEGDTDTESVRRDFYENTNRIKELLDGPHNDFSDVYRHKYSRNTTSSTSSQASLEILDRIPLAKREQVKQRRAALVCIFSFLDTRTLSRVARVCREWRIVSRSPKLWRRVELRGEKISPQFLRQISRRCSQLRVLILEDIHPRNRKKDESVEDYQKNIRCSLEAGYEQILKKAEATLHTIVIVNCGTLFSAKCMWIASCCCRMLKHVTYISDFDPINAEVMWALGSGCRELKTLKCQPIFPCAHADNFTTKCAQLIGKCFIDLEAISIGGLIVDVTALKFIAKQCQKLKHIEVHQMMFITCDVIDEMCQNGLQALKSIEFHATPVAPGALTVLQGHCNFIEAVFIQLTETDFTAAVTNQVAATLAPEYHEIVDGYEALKKQPFLCNILTLKLEHPKRPQVVKEPVQERSFFDRLFGKNE